VRFKFGRLGCRLLKDLLLQARSLHVLGGSEMAPDAPQENVWITAEHSDLGYEIAWQDAVATEPSVYLNVNAQWGEPREIGTHQLAHHGG
jgi:hypothetical protein